MARSACARGRGDCVKIAAAMTANPQFWRGRRVLVTGHTGFKGAWLCLWLQSLGADVTGLSAGVPSEPSLYELARVGAHTRELDVDVRDGAAVRAAVRASEAEVVLHLAAQPLVRRALREPVATYEVNVIGTVNVLDAAARCASFVRAVVVVTSDKCYANDGSRGRRFVEGDRLGGGDPYSSSKACAELAVAAFRDSLLDGPRVATARAGNVIGGGDWGQDRLVADAVRAVETATPLRVRNPRAVRPWQHVLSPLAGYLRLCEALCEGGLAARAWNLGPPPQDEQPVAWVVERLAELWQGELAWAADEGPHPPEAVHLAIDSTAAETQLGWRPACDLEEALRLVVAWHRAQRRGEDVRACSLAQIEALAGA